MFATSNVIIVALCCVVGVAVADKDPVGDFLANCSTRVVKSKPNNQCENNNCDMHFKMCSAVPSQCHKGDGNVAATKCQHMSSLSTHTVPGMAMNEQVFNISLMTKLGTAGDATNTFVAFQKIMEPDFANMAAIPGWMVLCAMDSNAKLHAKFYYVELDDDADVTSFTLHRDLLTDGSKSEVYVDNTNGFLVCNLHGLAKFELSIRFIYVDIGFPGKYVTRAGVFDDEYDLNSSLPAVFYESEEIYAEKEGRDLMPRYQHWWKSYFKDEDQIE